MMLKKPLYHCSICDHNWTPRRATIPKECPNCHSTRWNDPEGRKRPPVAQQREDAAKRKAEEAQKLARVPITEDMRKQMREKFELYQAIDSQVQMGTTNAGPWRQLDEEPPPPVWFLSLLNYKNDTDHFWRVSNDEEGMCLTGDDIWPGDILHFRGGVVPQNGNIVLALGHDIHGNSFATTKHYFERGVWRGNPIVELRPSNTKCAIIKAFPFNIEIEGVVENIIRVGVRKRETMRRSRSR